ncbi:MAG: UDP-N-acetylmuramoyl-tripeptide--D-alanyl-D-alanine ligase [Oscillibacter sp.]|nr:UDP-N-acetylmuramoyl-tripeptide--D-alanyl-D-alanine ligase [Oscillibacter sp.]MDD7000376.1 UDP-N-acetylmuramoyl-tripeptide--D-alanyl-D-alanine ligase [Oscillibacter sp.]
METITVKELLAATGGKLLQGEGTAKILGVNTDSRTIKAGEVFLPLAGERFDGHDYIEKALSAGAEGCLCARVPEALLPGKFYIKVPDTLLALKDLAAWYRSQFSIPFVQVTGSVGKTTTKEMIASVLGVKFHTLKTAANFNNEIGTPQTLLGLSSKHRSAVIETGMDRAGQIRYLGEMVKPDIAVITNVGDMHIEYLGSRENILKAKCEIFENLKKDGLAVLNGDDELLDTVTLPQNILRCGLSAHCNVRVSEVEDLGIDGIRCTVTTEKERYALAIPAPGKHMVYAAAMAAAIGEYLGETKEEIERGVAAYEPAGSRMHVIALSENRRLLDDCYNAGPQSMAASLRVLAASSGKKAAVIGDMAELGDLTESAHREIGELTKELDIDTVIAIGARAKNYLEGNGSVQWFQSVEEAMDAIKAAFAADTAMLVKASHSMHFETIVEELTKA